MGEGTHSVPPPKSDSELSDAEKEQLAKLKVDGGEEFNAIILEALEFCNSPDWKLKRHEKLKSNRGKESYEIVWEQMKSKHSSKMAAKFTVNVKKLTVASVECVLGDDPDLTDSKETMVYKYDRLIERNIAAVAYANNVFMSVTCHKAPMFTVAPREMHGYLSYLNSFSAEQQAKLHIVPKSAANAETDEEKRAAKELHVVCQCLVDYHHFNKRHGLDESKLPPTPNVRKKHVLGSLYCYLVMAQEELDGSTTLTMVIDVDPAGSLPTKVVDLAMSEQLEKVKLIVRLCEKEAVAGPPVWKTYENTRVFSSLHAPNYHRH